MAAWLLGDEMTTWSIESRTTCIWEKKTKSAASADLDIAHTVTSSDASDAWRHNFGRSSGPGLRFSSMYSYTLKFLFVLALSALKVNAFWMGIASLFLLQGLFVSTLSLFREFYHHQLSRHTFTLVYFVHLFFFHCWLQHCLEYENWS